MSAKTAAAVWTMTLIVMVVSYFCLDAPIALFFRNSLLAMGRRHALSTEIPDLLFPITCLVTVLGWTTYFGLVLSGRHTGLTRFLRLIGTSVPLAYLAKTLFKFVFGRVETRSWLDHPGPMHLHWFKGMPPYSGFPSGHMTVIIVLLLALDRYYPRHRRVYAAAFSLLAFMLLATDYHFLSDVIAGACLGLLVHSATAGALKEQA